MSSFHKNKQYFDPKWTIDKVKDEINKGLALLNSIHKPIVSFFGGARVDKNSNNYLHCRTLAKLLGKKGYSIVSGGGPGIMHAANLGAMDAKTNSIVIRAKLLTTEQITDKIFTHELDCHFIFVRRFILSIKSDALIFYPGGFGTLNELFEYLVLMQMKIVDVVPVICVNRKYWAGLFEWIKEKPLQEGQLTAEHLSLIHFADNNKEILRILNKKY